MSAASIVVLGIVFGLLVGVLFTLLTRAALDRGAEVLDIQATALPDGALAVLGALTQPALVVDGSNSVLQATPEAVALGLTDGRSLPHPELERLVDEARQESAARGTELVLVRAAGARNLVVTARAAPIDVARVLLLIDDRSDQVRLEAVRRDFVANVSHE